MSACPQCGENDDEPGLSCPVCRYEAAATPEGPPTIAEKVDALEALVHPEGRCTVCGGGKPYWRHIIDPERTDPGHKFVAAAPPEGPGDLTEPWTEMGRELLHSWTEPDEAQLAERSAWTRDWLALRVVRIEAEALAARLDAAGPSEREALMDKARKWHDEGMLTESEFGAICALLTVESIRAVPDAALDGAM